MSGKYEIGKLEERARGAVLRAIKSGKLVRPDTCSGCGDKPGNGADGRARIQAHHENGCDSPLDVIWLCYWCHTERHKELRRAAREQDGNTIPGPAQVAVEAMLRDA